MSAGGRGPLATGFAIGGLALDRRLVMAPMAGITTQAFRSSVRRWGAGLVHTEMISSHGVAYGNRRTLDYLRCDDDEHPIGFQLFGARPDVLARAAAVCAQAGADLIDLNMACPVRKVVKTGAGAALLAAPAQAEECVRAVVVAVGGALPVTVKIRAGVRSGDEAITIHARYASQLYRGRADHAITLALAEEMPVPVIASGDIADRATCAGLIDGGCAAVAVARAALGHPWVFAELLGGGPPPRPAERLVELRCFVDEVVALMGERAVGYLRRFWPRFRRSGTIDRTASLELMRASATATLAGLLAGAAPPDV